MTEKINVALSGLVVAIDSLCADPKNARKHGKKSIEAIKTSLSEYGQQKPIVVLHDGRVIAGNGMLEAAEQLGWKNIAAIVFSSREEALAKAYAIMDNKSAELSSFDDIVLGQVMNEIKVGIPDFDFANIGFSDGEIQKLLGGSRTPGEDDVPEPKQTDIQPGDVFTLGEHRLMCGDSTSPVDVKRLMGDEIADMVFTDPPYGVSYGVGNPMGYKPRTVLNDDLDDNGLKDMWLKAFTIMLEYSRPGCPYYICAPQGGTRMMMMMMMMIEKAGWLLKHELIWVKDQLVLGRSDYHYRHEPILYGWKEGAAHTWHGGRDKDSIINIKRPKSSQEHPTMKPVELIEFLLQNSSLRDQVVLDLFGGSGSTLVACENTKRRGRMMEIVPFYCQVIIDRWERLSGKKARKNE